jgi:gamma-glutamylcyclotransferase (GGCT)/AIG2-like uncharacterized protein YtfP
VSTFNLFVYGTLRTGGSAAERLRGCEKIADATIGGTLYDIEGRFPALVHYGTDPVHGEIWRCPADMLLALDEYEGTATGMFRRIAAVVESDTGESLSCWLYTAGPALSRQLTPANRASARRWQNHGALKPR